MSASWKIIRVRDGKVIETWTALDVAHVPLTHLHAKDPAWHAYRASLICWAQDARNGRSEEYRVEPVEVRSFKLEELNLPDWVLAELTKDLG